MNMPNVSNPIRDSHRGVVYDILAYRTLSRAERVTAVHCHLSHTKKKPKRGMKITIISIIGYND